MPAKGLFTSDHLPFAVIDSQAVIGLAISPFEEDLSFFQHMFDDAGWKLHTARTRRQAVADLSHGPIAVVICERHLIDGNWKDVLSRLASILNPPRLIVVSHRSDDGLWTEVLNMGGFDSSVLHFTKWRLCTLSGRLRSIGWSNSDRDRSAGSRVT
jgi:hypothetical protein